MHLVGEGCFSRAAGDRDPAAAPRRRRGEPPSLCSGLKLPAQPGILGHQPLVLRAQPAIAPIAPSAAQTPATTPRAPRTTSRPTLHHMQAFLHKQESSAATFDASTDADQR
jgi:hypothetical protein